MSILFILTVSNTCALLCAGFLFLLTENTESQSGHPGYRKPIIYFLPTRLQLERIRVLLADDHQVVLVAAARVLAREFDDVGAVSDGQTALDETERLQPDVLVSDISMPGMSGIEAARQLTGAKSDVKVVILTVHEDSDYVRESLTAGALGYVVKSMMASDLVDAVKAAFDDRSFVSNFPRL